MKATQFLRAQRADSTTVATVRPSSKPVENKPWELGSTHPAVPRARATSHPSPPTSSLGVPGVGRWPQLPAIPSAALTITAAGRCPTGRAVFSCCLYQADTSWARSCGSLEDHVGQGKEMGAQIQILGRPNPLPAPRALQVSSSWLMSSSQLGQHEADASPASLIPGFRGLRG